MGRGCVCGLGQKAKPHCQRTAACQETAAAQLGAIDVDGFGDQDHVVPPLVISAEA